MTIILDIILVASTSLHMQLSNFLIPALMIMFISAMYAACGNVLALKVFPEKAGIAPCTAQYRIGRRPIMWGTFLVEVSLSNSPKKGEKDDKKMVT